MNPKPPDFWPPLDVPKELKPDPWRDLLRELRRIKIEVQGMIYRPEARST